MVVVFLNPGIRPSRIAEFLGIPHLTIRNKRNMAEKVFYLRQKGVLKQFSRDEDGVRINPEWVLALRMEVQKVEFKAYDLAKFDTDKITYQSRGQRNISV